MSGTLVHYYYDAKKKIILMALVFKNITYFVFNMHQVSEFQFMKWKIIKRTTVCASLF